MSRGLTFALDQLPPALRQQAEAKLRELAHVREHRIRQPGEGEEPAKVDGRGRLKGVPPEVIARMRALEAANVSRRVIAQRCRTDGKTVARLLGVKESVLEKQLHRQLHDAGLTGWQTEYRFHPTRKWRLDVAWPELKFGVEVQGMQHRIKGRFGEDIEKQSALLLAGWRCLCVGGTQIRDGTAVKWIVELLKVPRQT